MKKLFVFIIKGLRGNEGYKPEIIELKEHVLRFKVNLYNTDMFVYIEVKHDVTFKMRLFKGVFVDKTLGAKGSKTIFEANNPANLFRKLEHFLTKPELHYHKVKVVHKDTQVFHAVGMRIGKRTYNTMLTENEKEKYSEFIQNPAESGKIATISRSGKSYMTKYTPNNIKVRGGSNKAARASIYQSILRPKSHL